MYVLLYRVRIEANRILNYFRSRNIKVMVSVVTMYVRPTLEYASNVWSLHLVKYIRLVESVQKRFTKYLPNMCHVSYMNFMKTG